MDNTNCGCECSFVKSGFCKTDKECPFYLESWWHKADQPQPKLVKDCFPKKLAIEQNNVLHRILCTQGVVEDVRNRMDRLELMLGQLIAQSKQFILEKSSERIDSEQESYKKLDYTRTEK